MICRLLNRLCALATLLCSLANAYNFSKCNEFYLKTSQVFALPSGAKVRAVHIGEGKYLAFSKDSAVDSALDSAKYDPFTQLVMFEGEDLAQKYDLISPKKLSAKNPPKLVAINENAMAQGQILRPQKSLKDFGTFSREIPPNSLISDICYQMHGIGIGGDRFIDSAHLAQFLARKSSVYSDLAFSVSGTKINAINIIAQKLAESNSQKSAESGLQAPAVLQNKSAESSENLQIGDEILAINGVKINDEYDFFDTASTLDSAIAKITLKRGEKLLQIPVRVFKRHRAFSQNGTELDILGIIVDDNLRIQGVSQNFYKFFAKNDKILRLNQIKISNKTELDSALKQALLEGNMLSFLIVRDDFEFFVSFDIMEVAL